MRVCVLINLFIVLFLIPSECFSGYEDITWVLGPDHPTFRKGGASDAFENFMISSGGIEYPWKESEEVFAYYPASSEWVSLPNMPVARAYTKGITAGDSFYVCGGRKADANGFATRAEVYKLSRNASQQLEWSQMPSMINHRGYHAIGKVGSKIIVAGGNTIVYGQAALLTPDSTINDVEWFDTNAPESGWQPLPPIPGVSRCEAEGVGIGSKFYLFGGYRMILNPDGTSTYPILNEALVLDTETRVWTRLSDMPFEWMGGYPLALDDQRYILLIGGGTYDYPERAPGWYNGRVLVYDTFTDTYEQLPTPMLYATNDVLVGYLNGKVYAAGGEDADSNGSFTDNHLRIGDINFIYNCGDYGYSSMDINKDCINNLLDFSTIASAWGDCTNPNESGCSIYEFTEDSEAYWRFEGSSGIELDSSGNGHNASLLGNAIRDTNTPVSIVPQTLANNQKSLVLDGSINTCAKISGSTFPDPHWSDFTLEAWVYPEGAIIDNELVIGGKFITGLSGDVGYYLAWRAKAGGTGVADFRVADSAGVGFITISSAAVVNQNHWTHVAGVRRGDEIKLYINGVLSTSSAFSGVLDLKNVNQDFRIGAGRSNSENLFIGRIDEFRYTLKALDADSFLSMPAHCGLWGYLPGDLNRDCHVDMDDIIQYADAWLFRMEP